MIDDELRQLNEAPLDRCLQTVEAEMWSELAMRVQVRREARRRVSLQSAVMALSLIISIAIGIHATRAAGAARSHALFTSGLELAPSSLLFGNAR
ncbi:MAG: hypothetical protein M3O26_03150 [Pseudomonadota bacterium]|nr:hypothetical protein [Pseudomonadota bacterium]